MQHMEFRPIADGIIEAQMKDINDWGVMRGGLCASLHGCQDPSQFCGAYPCLD
jgi:hypothetical protein